MSLTPTERRAIQYAATADPRAYDFYLRGRSYYNRMTKRGFTHALTLYQEAIERDPNYALAFVGIADVYSFLFKYGGGTPEIAGRALEASRRAVELGPDLAEAHSSRGLALSINGRHAEAEGEFERALRLNPSLYEAYYFYGRDCVSQGSPDKAARLFAKSVALNPDNYEALIFLAAAYRDSGKRAEAADTERRVVAAAEKHLEMYPDDARALYIGAQALVATGNPKRAVEWGRACARGGPRGALGALQPGLHVQPDGRQGPRDRAGRRGGQARLRLPGLAREGRRPRSAAGRSAVPGDPRADDLRTVVVFSDVISMFPTLVWRVELDDPVREAIETKGLAVLERMRRICSRSRR